MNVFKELIDELKEENLLEQTVIDADTGSDQLEYSLDPFESVEDIAPVSLPEANYIDEIACETASDANNGLTDVDTPVTIQAEPFDVKPQVEAVPTSQNRVNSREFYKKRAIGEMSNLQMVEHVLTGVEREYMKMIPKAFDDFGAKKALNALLQVADNVDSSRHSEAEFAIMEETEAWCTALAERDREIPVANLRRFCENSKPALSSQAMVALASFYRNLPYSETVRAKFDFLMTRLFSRIVAGNMRACLFTREEMTNHISLLYKEWSSVPLYMADDDESKVLLTALSFEELANEAENASSFDLLVANDFFGRLGMFKESVSEHFFAPNVTAAAIDCNVRVGNAYVKLIENERVKMDGQSLYAKFGAVDNLTVSDAAARTLEIVDILRKQRDFAVKESEQSSSSDVPPEDVRSFVSSEIAFDGASKESWLERAGNYKFIASVLSVNRWLLTASAILISLSIGVFAWTTIFVEPPAPDKSVVSVELPNSDLRKHLKTARVSGQNFYGLLLPSWDSLPKEKREDYLRTVFEFAQEKGCTQVNLLNSKGEPAGYANALKTDIIMP